MGGMEKPDSTVLAVLTTVDAVEKGEALARGAVEARLAACAQVSSGSVTSVYRWEGVVETAREWRVLLKTTRARYAELEAWLTEHHEYETPQIVALPVTHTATPYLTWLTSQVTP
ncbi:divalent-cation tolerance protein CutA [Streptomyces sp. VRA16 Mangrove soil]|uniref:divalent-cation tolerance protein CutA n=1 Tax=Streptomyces sp. VRA16 Mangrove soil TaxID=2817434 RepID=UPI001A9EF218|nr:divalent-cation tolerance protein CutA [Streptomyces sp. VRA16 Mangrove soil]MBO1336885.1 divalent-cation tolerance protein CutA [Streptomyces sp. VRA16 Mangrove soil]